MKYDDIKEGLLDLHLNGKLSFNKHSNKIMCCHAGSGNTELDWDMYKDDCKKIEKVILLDHKKNFTPPGYVIKIL